jgi:quercetin dioxygenase-like cupin family protein
MSAPGTITSIREHSVSGEHAVKPYVLAEGEGRTYEWHGIPFTIKAAGPETDGALAIWEVTTRPGEEPGIHVHELEHEIFYVLSGSITFHVDGESYQVGPHGFAFVPKGTPHTYTITSDEVRLLGFSAPSSFGDNIEKTGTPL